MWNKNFLLIIAGSPPCYKGDVDWSSVYSPKKGEVSKIVEECCLDRVPYVCC